MGLKRDEFLSDEEFVRWSSIMDRLCALEDTVSEGGIGATTRAMSRDEAAKLCLEIVRLHELHIVGMTQRDLKG